ncbi:ABC transporter substrate-binding protein [Prauserella cavernicola]|uniref:Extracellular solute-binding protein n=1 Tax=Prauserella cavernicola TaxID=2800127 RepID=A0A934QNQ8_9PSEU|nr:extracellular solute-binding protein [Prauserella cavernicola]MBK1783875.1 extracellular solute-binding protein [Prauserella cavernicola]
MRRRWLAVLATVLTLATTTSCSSSDREVVLYQSLSPTEIVPIVEGFEKYYARTTGESLNVRSFHQSGGDLRATVGLEARAESVQADLVVTDISDLTALEQNNPGLFSPVDAAALRDDAINDTVREQAAGSVGVISGLQPYVISYNTRRVPADDVPTSWADLLGDRWKFRIGMGDPETTNGAHVPLWYLTHYLNERIGSPFGWEFYDRLGELSPRTAGSHDAVQAYVNQGELDAGIVGYGTVVTAAEDGNPVAAVLPEEGVGALAIATAVPSASENGEIGAMFTEWLMSPEGQAAMYEGTNYIPVRDDVETSPPPFPIELDLNRIRPIDAAWVAEQRVANIDRFRQELG